MSDPATSPNSIDKARTRSRLWIGLLGVVAVAAVLAAVVLLRPDAASEATAATIPLNFADVVTTDLTQEKEFNGRLESIKGSGALIPVTQIDLSFATPGTVAELPVQVGQEVQAGDVLARVDASTVVAQDEIGVAQAQINLDVAQQALDELLNWELDAGEIAQLEANLAAAQAGLNAAQGQEAATGTGISVSEISVAQAQRQLADAQAAYQVAWDPARDWELSKSGDALKHEREAATAALQYAQENLQIAELNYQASVSGAGSSSSVSAQSQLLSAEQALATALAGPTEEQIQAAETAVAQDELNLQQAQLNHETHLAGSTIIAPTDGTVMNINGHLGGPVGTGPFITLADLSQPRLELYLGETNLDKVDVGSPVEVVFSALPDEQFSGTIVQVDPQLITGQELSVVRALAQLDAEQEQTLPAGLTAAVKVTGLSNRIVRVFLPLDEEGLLAVGDPVIVELPDLSEIPGTVVFVPQAPTPSVYGPASFEVLVEIGSDGITDDPAAEMLAGLPDETSVDVVFVVDAVVDMMAIPVSALVALLEGGYAVEVDAGGGLTRLVPVDVGFFGSNNMIAVTSDDLQPGDRVVVP